jgi:hypothetical protein
MSDDLRTQALKWFVETGYVDGGGIGKWDSTEESVEVESQAAANALRDEWIKQGKLIRTNWGELRPPGSYGIFRIRSVWVDVPNPLTARIEELEAERAVLSEALTVINALDPEALIDGCSQAALRGLVLRMGEIARTTIAELKGDKA